MVEIKLKTSFLCFSLKVLSILIVFSKIFSIFRFFIPHSRLKNIIIDRKVALSSELRETEFTELRPRLPTENDYQIISCVFKQMSISASGGAISISKSQVKAKISKCGFFNVLSTEFGGAVYFKGVQINANTNCFDVCIAMEGGQAIYCEMEKNSSNSVFEQNSLSFCSTSQLMGLSKAILFDRGSQEYSSLNLTKSTVECEGACLVSTRNTFFSISLSNFDNNTGVNMFWFYGIKEKDQFSKCNVIRSHLAKSDAIFTLESCEITIQYFRFIENYNNPMFGGGEKLTLLHSRFDVERKRELFPIKKYKIIDSFFEEYELKPHDIHIKSTEYCWVLGKPVIEKSIAIPELRIERPQQSNNYTMKIVYGAIVSLVGIIITYILLSNGFDSTTNAKLPAALYSA